MIQPLIRWGILGTANIARKNWQAIQNSGNSVLTAVASRDAARSRRFIEECQSEVPLSVVPTAYGSYESLLASPEVDAVYIPLPTGVRCDWVLRAAEAGKHVLCEKPCAPNLSDLQRMTAACRRQRVQFMDGVMFVHGLRLQRIKEVLKETTSIGEIRRITTQFSFRGDAGFFSGNMRANSALEPQGCVGDLGWYSLVFTLETLGGQMPREVSARLHSEFRHPQSPAAIPTEFSGELRFDKGVSASFYSSFITENQQWASISGTRGHLHVADFVLPFSGEHSSFEIYQPDFKVQGCHFVMEPRRRTETMVESSNNAASAQETQMIRAFANQVNLGTLNLEWPERALKVQRLLDACLESANRGGEPVLTS